MNFSHDIELAIEAAQKASHEIMQIYRHDFERIIKADGSPLTQADLNSSRVIMETLAKSSIPIISEEISNLPFEERKNWKRCWIVDPLDGTKEFIKKNDEFCVCIALVEDGKAVFGLIASPVQNKAWLAEKSIGLYEIDWYSKQRQLLPAVTAQQGINPVVLASRSHLTNETQAFINQLEVRYPHLAISSKGSALKFIDLALGKAHYYPRFAPTMEWDVAAGHVILAASGGKIMEVSTHQELCYNKENLINPHFVAVADTWEI